jgi:hypothetical protein
MAGIVAVASSSTHADDGADAVAVGFITGEQIKLTANPVGADYLWALAIPSTSNAARSRISGEEEKTAYFTPDAAGVYAVTVNVDGTTYILRLTVTQLAQSTALEALRLSPVADSQVAVPAAGAALYWSSTQDALALKDATGDVFTVDLTAV